MSLRRFLSLVESRPEFSCPSRLLADAIGADADAALRAAGVLAPRGRARWYPCARGRRGCRRSVAEVGGRIQVACGRLPPECPLECFDELSEHAVDEAALVRLLQALFDIEERSVRSTRQALWLGQSARDQADVWLCLRPSEPDFSLWMREHEESSQRALVLVPTPARIYAQTFDRYGPGQPVAVVHLDLELGIEGGRIVRLAQGHPPARVPWPTARPVERVGVRIRTPAGCRWGQIAFERVDGDTVAVRVGEQAPVRVTAAELGLTSATNGAHTVLWNLLDALCEGSGTCSRASVGAATIDVLKMRASRLSERLCAALGMPELPLHVDAETESVRSDFCALPQTRREMRRQSS